MTLRLKYVVEPEPKAPIKGWHFWISRRAPVANTELGIYLAMNPVLVKHGMLESI